MSFKPGFILSITEQNFACKQLNKICLCNEIYSFLWRFSHLCSFVSDLRHSCNITVIPINLLVGFPFMWRIICYTGYIGPMHASVTEICTTSWWRHQMEPFSALLALCAGNSPVPVNSPHKGQWRGALMFSLISAWIDGWVNNGEAGDLRRHLAHYDVIVMCNHTLSCWH